MGRITDKIKGAANEAIGKAKQRLGDLRSCRFGDVDAKRELRIDRAEQRRRAGARLQKRPPAETAALVNSLLDRHLLITPLRIRVTPVDTSARILFVRAVRLAFAQQKSRSLEAREMRTQDSGVACLARRWTVGARSGAPIRLSLIQVSCQFRREADRPARSTV